MGRGDRALPQIDESVATRIEALSPASQRWLKTVLHTIRTTTLVEDEPGRMPSAPVVEPAVPEQPRERAASLEDVITGEADLRDHLSAYPELAEELDGLADIIDMLRDAGEKRRKRGEQIFREEILGEPPGPKDGEELT